MPIDSKIGTLGAYVTDSINAVRRIVLIKRLVYALFRVGGSTRFKHLKKIPSFEVVQVAFANTASFREKKLMGDVSINAFLHDVVEFLLKVQI